MTTGVLASVPELFRRLSHSGRAIAASAALLAALVGAQAAAADPVGYISEFPSLPPGTVATAIAPGADGSLWWTDPGVTGPLGHLGGIGRITTQGEVAEFTAGLSATSSPESIAAGPDGNMWFTDEGSAPAIGLITPQGQITEFPLGTGSIPSGIALGPDGNMWFADNEAASPAIVRVTPQGQFHRFTAGLLSGSRPSSIAEGSDGSMWFTDQGTSPRVGRITMQGTINEYSTGASSFPQGIAPGMDGNLYFADSAAHAIGRIDPQTQQITYFPIGPNDQPRSVAPGPDGNVWFTDIGGRAIGKITPQGAIYLFNQGLSLSSLPLGLAPGADGNMWFTDTQTRAIGRVGTGAAAAVSAAPSLAGAGRPGQAESCQGAQWSNWSGVSASASLFSFDGYTWLRDGAPIAGQTGPSYTPSAADAGHALSCEITATYPFPLLVSAPATSGAVTVQPGGSAPGPAALTGLLLSQPSFVLKGRLVHGHCVRATRATRGHRRCTRPAVVHLTYNMSAAAMVTISVAREAAGRMVGGSCVRASRANHKHRRCTRLVLLGTVVHASSAGANELTITGQISGHQLVAGSYRLTATPNAGTQKTLLFRIAP